MRKKAALHFALKPSAMMDPSFWRNSLTMTLELKPGGALMAVTAPLGDDGAKSSESQSGAGRAA